MKTLIDEHRDAYGIEPICKVLPIAPSTYYTHAARRSNRERQPARARRDATLCEHIRRVWEENFQGSLRSKYTTIIVRPSRVVSAW
jgi:putative transposase